MIVCLSCQSIGTLIRSLIFSFPPRSQELTVGRDLADNSVVLPHGDSGLCCGLEHGVDALLGLGRALHELRGLDLPGHRLALLRRHQGAAAAAARRRGRRPEIKLVAHEDDGDPAAEVSDFHRPQHLHVGQGIGPAM